MNPYRLAVLIAAAFFLVIPNASAQDKQDKNATKKDGGKMARNDMQALTRFAQADMAEIEAGKLAAQKASSAEVKKYGEHMVDEHTKMLEEGKKLAQSKGVQPPAQTDKKHQSALKKLQGLSGDEFDRAYLKQMVNDHQDVLKLARKTAKDAKDPDLKAHAEQGTPHIQEHLDTAKKLAQAGASRSSDKAATKSSK